VGAPQIPQRRVRAALLARPSHALLLAASCALALGGCGRADAPLQPVYRLMDTLDPALSGDDPVHCDIADEFRPAIGCMPYVAMGTIAALPRPQGTALTVPVTIPATLSAGMIVVEPKVRGPREEWRRTPTMLLQRPASPRTELVLPLPDQVKGDKIDAQLFGRPVPPSAQDRVTRPLKIGRGARLTVGLGLDPLSGKVGAAPVEFRLTAETPDGDTELLRAVLDPRTVKTWQDHVVDLAALAGQRVRFRFVSQVMPRGGADPAQAFGFPLWGAAQVLEPRSRDGRRNVILISLDTMRGDQLGGSLDGIPLMPALAERAAGGAVFENAFTTYPSTTAGHMSMLTGLYPAAHGMVFATGVLSPHIATLPEIFARNGYATTAVTEDAMLSANVGFVRGFDFYRELKGKTLWATTGEIEHTFGTGLRWIEEHPDERFFLFLHTYQVHAPYEPPPEFDIFNTWEKDGQRLPIDATTPKPIRDRHLYAGEVRYVDAVLDKLLQRLGELGVLDDTIVVVTADHGDEFGEHGQVGHAKTAYDEVLHVPLVFLSPRLLPAGKRVATPVSLIDVVPTLLDLTRLPVPSGLHGTSLVPLLRGLPFPASRTLFAEAPPWGAKTGHRVAARSAGFKWIASDEPGVAMQIYDLTTDPGETKPLADPTLAEHGAALESAYRALGSTRKAAAPAKAEPEAAKKPGLDEATVEKLKALGYMD